MPETTSAALKRFVICAAGIFFYVSGVALTKNCDLGISPIVSVAYSLSLVTGITLGWCTTIFNLALFALQRVLLGTRYRLRTAAEQLLMSICFSLAIDFADMLWGAVRPTAYVAQLFLFIVSCAILACGMDLILLANYVVMPAEGAVVALVSRTRQPFNRVKISFDASMVLLTCIISLIFLGTIAGVREGTLLAVILIGAFSKPLQKIMRIPPFRQGKGPG